MRYPILRLNVDKVESNIRKISNKAKDLGLEFRPHFKTHQSREIGEWFRKSDVNTITVSSLTMAEYFANSGWNDITVAFPVNILDLNKIDNLAAKIELKLLVGASEIVDVLDQNLTSKVSVYIEIDPQYGRSGVKFSNHKIIQSILNRIRESTNINFEGFYAHAGHSYKCRGENEIKDLVRPILKNLSELKTNFGGKLCWGDTPSCSILEDFEEVDQISPGNFVFYDWMQTTIGSCTPGEIAVKMECPVVAKYEDRKELLIHGGAVHFSKDFILKINGDRNFGQIINPDAEDDLSNYLKSISQEHGIVSCSESFFKNIQVGDIVSIYPIHSCLTANLMQAYILDNGGVLEHFSSGAPFRG